MVSMSVSIGSSELPELRDAHEAAKLGPYLRDVWSRQSYIKNVAINELRSRQATNVLGSLWHLLNPALTIGVYYLVFGVIIQTDRGVDNFLVFLTIGLFVFQFGQKSTIDGARSVVSNKGLIKAVRFPRVILPITSTYTEVLAALPTFAVTYLVALVAGVAAHVALAHAATADRADVRVRRRHGDDRRPYDDPLRGHHADPALRVPAAPVHVGRDLQRRRLRGGQRRC